MRLRNCFGIVLAVVLLSACRLPAPVPPSPSWAPTPPVVTGSASSLKLLVSASGVYRVTGRDLLDAGAGWSQAMLDPARLSLAYTGQAVPAYFEGQGTDFSLIFFGLGSESRYTPYRAYWLSGGDGLLQMRALPQAQAAPDACPVPKGDVEGVRGRVITVTQHFEQDALYVSRAPEADTADNDRWFWRIVSAPRRVTLTLSLESEPLVFGPARLTLAMWGSTSAAVQPDHHILVSLNTRSIGEHQWDGIQARQRVVFDLLPGTLRAGANKLVIALPGDTGAAAETTLIDWVELAYQQALPENPTELPAIFESDWQNCRWQNYRGIPPGITLIDISDPASPMWVEHTSSASFTDTRRYASVASPYIRRADIVPAALSPDWRTVLAEAETNYLIVADPALRAVAEPLVKWRASQELNVALVTTDEVYDQFGRGEPDPAAVRALIRLVFSGRVEQQPPYVLLLGDATYDYRNVLGKPPPAQVISPMINVAFSGETTSDVWLADVDEDGLPDVPLGRIPARNASEAAELIARTIDYEKAPPAGDWRRRVLMVADPSEESFARVADSLIEQLPAGRFEVTQVYRNDPSSVTRALNEGALLAIYVGHGSLRLWGKGGLLTAEVVDKLSNAERRPLVVNFTCLTGYFAHPTAESLGEQLLRAPGGGAVATIAPSSLTLPDDQSLLARLLVEALSDPSLSVGEALLHAQRESSSSRDVTLTYHLLGDPALKLKR